MVEVEFWNRNADGLMTTGRLEALSKSLTTLFLRNKIWRKTQNGFAAVAILRGKPPDTQQIPVLNAVDFGTRETDRMVRERFNTPPARTSLLPGVLPVGTGWHLTRVQGPWV